MSKRAFDKIATGLREAIKHAKEQNTMTDKAARAAFDEWNLHTRAPHRTLYAAFLAGRAVEASVRELAEVARIGRSVMETPGFVGIMMRDRLAEIGLRVVKESGT